MSRRKKRKVSKRNVKKILIDEASLESDVKRLESSPHLEFRIALVTLLDTKSVRFYIVKQRRIEPEVEKQWKNLSGIQKVAYVLQKTKFDHKVMSSIYNNTGGSTSYIRAHPLQAILRKIERSRIETLFKKYIKQEGMSIDSMRNDLIMKFYDQPTSLERRRMEEENIKEMGDFMARDEFRFVDVCETTIPIEILQEIFSFLHRNSSTLYQVGSVCKTFYLLLLTTWDEILITPKTMVKNISMFALQNVRSVEINLEYKYRMKATKNEELLSSIDYVIRRIGTSKRLRRLKLSTPRIILSCLLQTFEKAKKDLPELFSNLKELEIRSSYKQKFRLTHSLFPNLSSFTYHPGYHMDYHDFRNNIGWPNIYSVMDEDNMKNLRAISVPFPLLFVENVLGNVKRGSLLSNLQVLKVIKIEDPNYHLHLNNVINSSDKLRELSIFFEFYKIRNYKKGRDSTPSFTFPVQPQLKKLSISCVLVDEFRYLYSSNFTSDLHQPSILVNYPKVLKLEELSILRYSGYHNHNIHREPTLFAPLRIDFCLETMLEQRFLHNCDISNMYIDIPLLSERFQWKELIEEQKFNESFMSTFTLEEEAKDEYYEEEIEKENKRKLKKARRQMNTFLIPLIRSLLELLVTQETIHKFQNLVINSSTFGYFARQALKIRIKRSLADFGILYISTTDSSIGNNYRCSGTFGEFLFEYDLSKEEDWSNMIMDTSKEEFTFLPVSHVHHSSDNF